MKKLIFAVSLALSLSMCKYKEYSALRSSVETLKELENQNDIMRQKITQLERNIKAMKTNKIYQEQVIRDELGWQRKNDITIEFCIEPSCGPDQKAISKS